MAPKKKAPVDEAEEGEKDQEMDKKPSGKAKAKAKSASTVKPKAVVKATGKAKAKAKSATNKSKVQQHTLKKKPAAKAASKAKAAAKAKIGSLNRSIQDMKAGIEDEDAEDENTHRDKGKAIKFNKQRSQLPPHVLHLLEVQSQEASSPRAFKTQIINKLYKREKDGSLTLNLGDAIFREHELVYKKKFARSQSEALPGSIFRGLYFQGSQAALEAAVACGDVKKVRQAGDDGVETDYYAFKKYVVGEEQGKNVQQELTAEKTVSARDAEDLRKALKAVGWSLDTVSQKAVVQENGKMVTQVNNLIKQAQAAQEKLAKEALSCIKAWQGSSETLKHLKKDYATSVSHISQITHVRDLRELPSGEALTKEGFDTFMLRVAKLTEAFNVTIAKAKAEMKAQNN